MIKKALKLIRLEKEPWLSTTKKELKDSPEKKGPFFRMPNSIIFFLEKKVIYSIWEKRPHQNFDFLAEHEKLRFSS